MEKFRFEIEKDRSLKTFPSKFTGDYEFGRFSIYFPMENHKRGLKLFFKNSYDPYRLVGQKTKKSEEKLIPKSNSSPKLVTGKNYLRTKKILSFFEMNEFGVKVFREVNVSLNENCTGKGLIVEDVLDIPHATDDQLNAWNARFNHFIGETDLTDSCVPEYHNFHIRMCEKRGLINLDLDWDFLKKEEVNSSVADNFESKI